VSETVRVRLEGEIDLAVREDVDKILDDGVAQALAAGTPLHVDLSEVTFFDSTGLACVVQTLRALTAGGSGLRLVDVPAPVLRTLEIVGLDHLVQPT
jgi:anti-anti-sigma factor